MKRGTRLYNVMFPIWMLCILPQTWLIILPGNLLIDCLMLLLTLTALKRRDKRRLMDPLWWQFWWRGFAADALGTVWMLLGELVFEKLMLGRRPGQGYYVSPFGPLTEREKTAALSMAVFTASWTFLLSGSWICF